MINFGEVGASDLPLSEDTAVKLIRVAFHRKDFPQAVDLCKDIAEKGYKICLQPMFTMGYSDAELLNLVDASNSLRPFALYIVDTFGSMDLPRLMHIFRIIDQGLDSAIRIGWHAHNNLQLAFSNAQSLILMPSDRNLVLDASLFGMGRGAGNLCTELIVPYLNINRPNSYSKNPILEAIDSYILPIYNKTPWGYSAPYLLTAQNDTHPNYASFLISRHDLNLQSMGEILEDIPENERAFFKKDVIESCHANHKIEEIEDTDAREFLYKELNGKHVLLVGSGASLKRNTDMVLSYIADNAPVVVSVDFIADDIRTDYAFFISQQKFNQFVAFCTSAEAEFRDDIRIITTSNIRRQNKGYDTIYISFTRLARYNTSNVNSKTMAMHLLADLGVERITLIGFDPLEPGKSDDIDMILESYVTAEEANERNELLLKQISILRETVNVEFLLGTDYECRFHGVG
jgi:4-hydroxy 2-oxovalerate aldolase